MFTMGLLALFGLTGLAGLIGCDQQRAQELEEGVSTEAAVRLKFGEPEKIWDGQNGDRVLEYNRQPAGNTNYMISIGPDGKMSSLRQVLTARNFARVEQGMMMEDVRKMLGKPAKVSYFSLKKQTHYDWRWLDAPNQQKMFTVIFDADLRVVSSASADEIDNR
jgi:SmpA / OmlA family